LPHLLNLLLLLELPKLKLIFLDLLLVFRLGRNLQIGAFD
jgi:hypothetical protein